MEYPLVSVIIPCYNSEKYIAEAIESALNQTYPNIEVVVIDDGSTDNSLEIIKSYSNRVVYETQLNSGAPAARNHGIKLASGDLLNFFDADDLLLPDAVMVRYLNIENYDAIYGNEIFFSEETNNIIKKRNTKPPYTDNLLASFLNPSGHPITNAVLIKKKCFKTVLWREDLKSGQEFYLWLDLIRNGFKFKYIDVDITKIRVHHSPDRISNQGRKKIYDNKYFLLSLIQQNFSDEISQNKDFACELNFHFLKNSLNTLRFWNFSLSNKFYYCVDKKLVRKHPEFEWMSPEAFTYLTNQYIGFFGYQIIYLPCRLLRKT